jgi:hypothetical protein
MEIDMKQDTTTIDPTWMERTGGFAKDMTMRDYLAAKAMLRTSVGSSYEHLAKTAYEIADAMLKAREAK